MKVASFNMENIFFRDERLIKRNVSNCLSSWMTEFENLMSRESRHQKNYVRLRELSFLLGFNQSALEPYVILRRKAGQLYMRRRTSELEIKAHAATGWNGWIKLCSRPIDEIAVRNKARLISEVNPDVLIVQEVEDRQSLLDFNEIYLPEEVRFSNVYVLGGNDSMGRELGILTKSSVNISCAKNYADKVTANGQNLFELDFQEFNLVDAKGDPILVMSACMAEKEIGSEKADLHRKLQAEAIAMIYEKRRGEGFKKIIVAGTFNVPSYCATLSPLLQGTDLKEIKKHKSFNVDFDNGKDAGYYSLGAYRKGVNTKQQDYLLLSPALFERVENSGLNRKGIFPGKKDQFHSFPTVMSEQTQASSHPLTWFKTG
ncbi:MAG: hypothetical protein R3218_01115 [Christiangramia sp.]|nr:hypothetical protein [Christiangramia sp.]